jgi:hypothetical protein
VGGAASVVALGVLAFGFAGAKTQPLEGRDTAHGVNGRVASEDGAL